MFKKIVLIGFLLLVPLFFIFEFVYAYEPSENAGTHLKYWWWYLPLACASIIFAIIFKIRKNKETNKR